MRNKKEEPGAGGTGLQGTVCHDDGNGFATNAQGPQGAADPAPRADKAEAARFLKLLDPAATSFTFQTFADGKKSNKKLARILHGTLDECWDQLDDRFP